MEKLFPTILIALSLAAAITYLFAADYRKCLYWLFAAGLNATVTY